MEHRRPDPAAPAAGPFPGGPVRAARTAETGRAGDTRVAGPPPAPAVDAPGTSPDTSPDTGPATAPDPFPAPGDAAPDGGRAPSTAGPSTGPASGPQAAPPSGAPEAPPSRRPAAGPAGPPEKLFDATESQRFRERWREVQAAFVDDPGDSVRKADELASEAVEVLSRTIAAHRRSLSDGLDDREHADTERLRLALRGYRDLLDRIFAA